MDKKRERNVKKGKTETIWKGRGNKKEDRKNRKEKDKRLKAEKYKKKILPMIMGG
jgi:hypothetical protein